jgi:hypothetical protein
MDRHTPKNPHACENLNDLSNGEKLILYYFYEIHKALKKSNSWQFDYQFIKNLNDNLYRYDLRLKKRIDLKTVLMEGHALAVAEAFTYKRNIESEGMTPEDIMQQINEFLFGILFHDLGLYTKYTVDEYKYPERAGELNNKWKNTSNPLRKYIVQWYWYGIFFIIPYFGFSNPPPTLIHNDKMLRYLNFFENIKLHKTYHTEFVLELEKNIEQIQKSEFKRMLKHHQDILRKSEEYRIRRNEEILWKGKNTNIKTNKKRNNRSNNSKSRNNKNGKNNRSNNPKSRNNQKSKKNKKH